MVALKLPHHHFSLENECLKARKRKGQRVLIFEDLEACGCARVWDFEEIETKIEALEEIWSSNHLVFFLFIFLSFLMSFMAILSLCIICAFTLTMSS